MNWRQKRPWLIQATPQVTVLEANTMRTNPAHYSGKELEKLKRATRPFLVTAATFDNPILRFATEKQADEVRQDLERASEDRKRRAEEAEEGDNYRHVTYTVILDRLLGGTS